MFVRALCTRVRDYTVVYVHVCVRCIIVRVHVCARVRVCAYVRACGYVCVHVHVKGLKTPFLLVSFLPKRGPASQAVCPPWGP